MALDHAAFIFGFAPLVVLLCAVARQWSPGAVPGVLLLASMVFLAATDVRLLLFMAAMTLFNIAAARAADAIPDRAGAIRTVAIIAHLAPLVLWKYAPGVIGAAPGHMLLGLSYVTFLHISCLLDLRDPAAPRLDPVRHALYANFFAAITAGPITRYSALAPQLMRLGERAVPGDVMVAGLALCVMGLAKVAIIGRPMIDMIAQVHAAMALGLTPSVVEAWLTIWGGLLGMYFLFSGYSDTAIGLGMLVGLRLAINFNSPLKAMSASDFVSRWHMSLTDWVRAYLYAPILKLARRVPLGSRDTQLTIGWSVATIASFTVIGAWHGATYLFIIGGLVSGIMVVLGQVLRPGRATRVGAGLRAALGRISLLTVLAGLTLIHHAASVSSAWAIVRTAFAPGVLNLSPAMQSVLPELPFIAVMHNGFLPNVDRALPFAATLLAGATAIALFAPNSMQIFGLTDRPLAPRLRWRISIRHGVMLGLLGLLTAMSMTDRPGFFYDGF